MENKAAAIRVFSADDFGLSATANKNILKLVKLGKIQRVSVLVNGILSGKEAEELLKSKVKLDVHLEMSVTFVFFRLIHFVSLYLIGRVSAKKIEKEWESQIQTFINIFGQRPDGLNSHEHVHFFPPYFKIALKLCQKYKIPRVRFGSNGIVPNGNKIGWILKSLNWYNQRHYASYSLKLKAYNWLTSLDWMPNGEKLLKHPPAGDLEIICHPERREEYIRIKRATCSPV